MKSKKKSASKATDAQTERPKQLTAKQDTSSATPLMSRQDLLAVAALFGRARRAVERGGIPETTERIVLISPDPSIDDSNERQAAERGAGA